MELEITDPEQAKIIFQENLSKNLSASHINRLSEYCYKFKDSCSQFFEIILNVLNSSEIPLHRLNLLYLFDSLLKSAPKYNFYAFNEMIIVHIWDILKAVLGDGSQSNVNSGIGKVVSVWRSRNIIQRDLFESIENWLKLYEVVVSQDQKILDKMERDRDRQKKSREEGFLISVHGKEGEFPFPDPEFTRAWNLSPQTLSSTDIKLLEHYTYVTKRKIY